MKTFRFDNQDRTQQCSATMKHGMCYATSPEQRPLSQADNYSAGQEISCPLLNPNSLRITPSLEAATGH
jgi:hypothetical protein